jgi:hypothetical protein
MICSCCLTASSVNRLDKQAMGKQVHAKLLDDQGSRV